MNETSNPESQAGPTDALAAALGAAAGSGSGQKIAADVSSGLAGLLANLLATSREEPSEPEVPPVPEVIPEPAPPRLRNANYEVEPGIIVPPSRLNDVFSDSPVPRPRRALNEQQLALFDYGLSKVCPRAGEEGLPHAIVLMRLLGADRRFEQALLDATSEQLQHGIRGGDVVLTIEDIGLALFCGGLFFPGDVEVLGSRLRRRTLERLSGILNGIEFSIVMAGALGTPNEPQIDLIHRAVSTLDESLITSRPDIVIDYGNNALANQGRASRSQ